MMVTSSMQRTGSTAVAELRLMAHLLRRAGFGATRDELDRWCALGYPAAVEMLLNPAPEPADHAVPDHDLLDRFFTASVGAIRPQHAWPQWSWRLLTTTRPLEEKLALFWHGLFATGPKYPMHSATQLAQVEMFRQRGLGCFDELLLALSRDPAMLFWLDNQLNHADAPNENYGRELLELFSMGVGNYTEDDVRAAAQAFTGWTVRPPHSPYAFGHHSMAFTFDAEDHDSSDKTFLGHRGPLDGADVIAIIARQPATARFICERLYRFFVADQPDAAGRLEIERLTGVFRDSGREIRAVLRALFLAEHFASPAVRYRKVKSPVELVYGTARLLDRWTRPDHEVAELASDTRFMGQSLLDPPNVAGWQEGEEWIDTAGLVERVNFTTKTVARRDCPGVRRMLDRIAAAGPHQEPEELVSACLDALGAIEVSPKAHAVLVGLVRDLGPVDFHTHPASAEEAVTDLLQAIVVTPDYQYC